VPLVRDLRLVFQALLGAALLALLSACSGGKAAAPPATTPASTQNEQRGEVVFMRTCNGCHPQGEAGLGGALNTKPLPGALIKAKVRGTLPGDMPKFGDRDLGDADLQAVVDYVAALRRQP
jgi:mono/diheme cytochrome c family protein